MKTGLRMICIYVKIKEIELRIDKNKKENKNEENVN
jgi:hypothetical protein